MSELEPEPNWYKIWFHTWNSNIWKSLIWTMVANVVRKQESKKMSFHHVLPWMRLEQICRCFRELGTPTLSITWRRLSNRVPSKPSQGIPGGGSCSDPRGRLLWQLGFHRAILRVLPASAAGTHLRQLSAARPWRSVRCCHWASDPLYWTPFLWEAFTVKKAPFLLFSGCVTKGRATKAQACVLQLSSWQGVASC